MKPMNQCTEFAVSPIAEPHGSLVGHPGLVGIMLPGGNDGGGEGEPSSLSVGSDDASNESIGKK